MIFVLVILSYLNDRFYIVDDQSGYREVRHSLPSLLQASPQVSLHLQSWIFYPLSDIFSSLAAKNFPSLLAVMMRMLVRAMTVSSLSDHRRNIRSNIRGEI